MVRLKEAENSATIKNLKNKIDDLEQVCNRGSLLPNEPPRGKTNNVVSEQVRHKPACTSTE